MLLRATVSKLSGVAKLGERIEKMRPETIVVPSARRVRARRSAGESAGIVSDLCRLKTIVIDVLSQNTAGSPRQDAIAHAYR